MIIWTSGGDVVAKILRSLFVVSVTTLLLDAHELRSIDAIKAEYRTIHDHLPGYIRQQKDLDGVSSEGAVAEIYRDGNGTVKRVTVKSYGERGKEEAEYYFHNDRLFFLYEVTTRYNAPIYAEGHFDPKRSRVFRDRYYFIGGKMVRWIDRDHRTVSPESKAFREREREIFRFVERYFTFLHEPYRAIPEQSRPTRQIESTENRPGASDQKGSQRFGNKLQKRLHWEKAVGHQRKSTLLKAMQSRDGGYVIALRLSALKGGKSQLLFLKYGRDGSLAWRYAAGKADNNLFVDLHEERDGSLRICRESETEGDTGAWMGAWIDLLSANGTLLWSREIETADPGELTMVVCDSLEEGGYVAAGDRIYSGTGESDFWIDRLDVQGRKRWQKRYAKYGDDHLLKVVRGSDGGFVILGFREKRDTGTHLWAMKLDASGKTVWERYLGESDSTHTITVTRSAKCSLLIVDTPDKKGAGKKRVQCLEP